MKVEYFVFTKNNWYYILRRKASMHKSKTVNTNVCKTELLV